MNRVQLGHTRLTHLHLLSGEPPPIENDVNITHSLKSSLPRNQTRSLHLVFIPLRCFEILVLSERTLSLTKSPLLHPGCWQGQSLISGCTVMTSHLPVQNYSQVNFWRSDTAFEITMSSLHAIIPVVGSNVMKKSLNRRDSSVLNRVHTRLTYSHLLSGEPPPICSVCQIALTVQHFMLDCPQFTVKRAKYFTFYHLKTCFTMSMLV